MKKYWKELVEEYTIPLPKTPFEQTSGGEIFEWFLKDQKQKRKLLEKYGESARRIFEFTVELKNKEISERFFRQLVLFEIDKCFKKLNDVDK